MPTESDTFHRALLSRKARLLFPGQRELSHENWAEVSRHLEEMLKVLGSLEAISLWLDLEAAVTNANISEEFWELFRKSQQRIVNDPASGDAGLALGEHLVGMAIRHPRLQPLLESHPDRLLQIVLLAEKVKTRMTVATPEEPPPPNDPEDYDAVEPENLTDIEWPNGSAIRFTFAQVLKDNQGRERRFYNAQLEYIPTDATEISTVDLSKDIPGKSVLFEGTSGSLSGANMKPLPGNLTALGWASPLARAGHHLVALNLERLRDSSLQGAVTIFHELGHVYLFGEPDKEILDKPAHPFWRWAKTKMGFGPIVPTGHLYQTAVEELRHASHTATAQFQQDTDNFRQKVGRQPNRQRLTIERGGIARKKIIYTPAELKTLQHLQDQLAQNRYLDQLLAKASAVSDVEYCYLQRHLPGMDLLWRIFQERNADAFAFRRIRQLKLDEPRDLRSRSVKNIYSRAYNDDRFAKGVARKTS